jgi:3-isopropylmalate/(R)-2-methylmalate dehydratase small subunit
MVITGYARRIAQDITTSDIIAPAHAASSDPALLAAYCLETIDPHLAEEAHEGDILIVAGHIRTTSAPDDAVFALQALGIAAVVCAAADEALHAAAAPLGLPLLPQQEAAAAIAPAALLRLDLERGRIEDQTHHAAWTCPPCSPAALAAVRRVLLLQRMRRVVEDEGYAE